MGRKKRKAKRTIFGAVEGIREKCFLDYLIALYQPRANNINPTFSEPTGGTPDFILNEAMKSSHDQSFAWIDEDNPLSEELRKKLTLSSFWNISENKLDHFLSCPLKDLESKFNLKKRNPRLIVSQPVCVESFILKVLGKDLPYEQYESKERNIQIKTLKNKVDGIIGKTEEQQRNFYAEGNLTKEMLEEKRQSIPELDILISMIT